MELHVLPGLVWKCVSQLVLAAEFVNFYKSHSNNTIMKKMDGCFSLTLNSVLQVYDYHETWIILSVAPMNPCEKSTNNGPVLSADSLCIYYCASV